MKILMFLLLFGVNPEFRLEKIFDTNDFLNDSIEVKGASQGFAVYNGLGFFFHDKGQVLIVDLDKRELVSTFVVPGLERAHCNNACFSDEMYSESSSLPLLYVTECGGSNRCYVVDLNFTTGEIVQSIWYDGDDYNKTFDWCIDPERSFIYTRGGNHFYWKISH